jgi:Protein of unknown function (DUF2782)
MRRLIPVLFLALVLPVAAQQRPADLQPVPEPPPPPPGYQPDPALEPQVTIIRRGEDKVEEFRVNGRLYMVKVTPPHGVPYYLVDDKGDGRMTRQDSLDSGLRVPMWVIGTF